ISVGIEIAVASIAERGWKTDLCMIPPDKRARPMLEKQLAAARYDYVVIGAKLRLPHKSLSLFKCVLNVIHKAAPDTAIAFNTRPENTAEAAGRWLQAGD